MVVLCLSVSYVQSQETTAPQNTPRLDPSSQSTASPAAPAPEPASSPASPAPGLKLSSGLNSFQGLKVARIQVNGLGIDDTESLLSKLPQKVNEPLDRYKVRQSV